SESPRDPRGVRQSGSLQRRIGEHDAARKSLERALLLKPDDPATLVELAALERGLGKFAEAQQRLNEAMNLVRTPQQRSAVLAGISELRSYRGDFRGSVSAYQERLAEEAKYQAPAVVLVGRLSLPARMARMDPAAGAKELARLHAELQTPWDMYLPVADMQYYTEVEDVARAEQAVTALEALIAKQNFKVFSSLAHYARGRVQEIRGDCRGAIANYQESLKLEPLDAGTRAYVGRCYRKLGDRARSQAELAQALRASPASGFANLEMGLLMKESGDAPKAKAYLQRAMATWQEASPNHKQLQEARAALQAL
ncbi:MAG TPA: hypothetical protein VFZ04_13565, partial [Longimicrobiales bacterium]